VRQVTQASVTVKIAQSPSGCLATLLEKKSQLYRQAGQWLVEKSWPADVPVPLLDLTARRKC